MPQKNDFEAFEALKQYLQNEHNAKVASGGSEIIKRCHICGDSKDVSNRHMYIGMRDGIIVYNCFKCNAKGIVDRKFLRDIGCYDDRVLDLCNEQNKSKSSSSRSNSGLSTKQYKPKQLLIPFSDNEFALKKLNYINNRTGFIFNSHDAARFKIVLNLKEFLAVNNITNYTRHPDMVDLIDKFFIGFLSADNSHVALRRLVPEGKLPEFIDHRYIEYNIYGNKDGNKFYIVPGIVDLGRPLEVHVAEGAFDIISVYTNLAIGANGIFMAVGGKSYIPAIKFLISTYGITYFNLHLYLDADVGLHSANQVRDLLKPFSISVYVHRNQYPGEKDYGVPANRIDDRFNKI